MTAFLTVPREPRLPAPDKSLYGPAGAIWVQGGTVTVDAGAYIGGSTDKPMIGRGIYLDGGEVEMNRNDSVCERRYRLLDG